MKSQEIKRNKPSNDLSQNISQFIRTENQAEEQEGDERYLQLYSE
jgi:hypothetical protein